MSSLKVSGLAARLLARASVTSSLLRDSVRGLRYQRKVFRTRVPQYKIDPIDFTPLSELLVQKTNPAHLEEAKQLRKQKFEVYTSYVGKHSQLLEALFHPDNDADKLLKLIDYNLDIMTSFYMAISFEALDDMLRAKLCQPETVLCSPEFRRLCERTIYKIRFFEADEVLKLIKCLASVGIPANTLLVQATYRMAQHFINDYEKDELGVVIESMASLNQIEDHRHHRLKD